MSDPFAALQAVFAQFRESCARIRESGGQFREMVDLLVRNWETWRQGFEWVPPDQLTLDDLPVDWLRKGGTTSRDDQLLADVRAAYLAMPKPKRSARGAARQVLEKACDDAVIKPGEYSGLYERFRKEAAPVKRPKSPPTARKSKMP